MHVGDWRAWRGRSQNGTGGRAGGAAGAGGRTPQGKNLAQAGGRSGADTRPCSSDLAHEGLLSSDAAYEELLSGREGGRFVRLPNAVRFRARS